MKKAMILVLSSLVVSSLAQASAVSRHVGFGASVQEARANAAQLILKDLIARSGRSVEFTSPVQKWDVKDRSESKTNGRIIQVTTGADEKNGGNAHFTIQLTLRCNDQRPMGGKLAQYCETAEAEVLKNEYVYTMSCLGDHVDSLSGEMEGARGFLSGSYTRQSGLFGTFDDMPGEFKLPKLSFEKHDTLY